MNKIIFFIIISITSFWNSSGNIFPRRQAGDIIKIKNNKYDEFRFAKNVRKRRDASDIKSPTYFTNVLEGEDESEAYVYWSGSKNDVSLFCVQ